GGKRGGKAVHGAFGHPQPARQLADADIHLLLGKGLEQLDRCANRRQAFFFGGWIALAGDFLFFHDLPSPNGYSAAPNGGPKSRQRVLTVSTNRLNGKPALDCGVPRREE